MMPISSGNAARRNGEESSSHNSDSQNRMSRHRQGPSPVNVSLPTELSRFTKQTKRMKVLLKDTRNLFSDINQSNQNSFVESTDSMTSQVPLPKIEFQEDEYKTVSRIIGRVPTFVVFGQSAYAKGILVNELFGQPILPAMTAFDANSLWRMVRFKYGPRPAVGLSLSVDFELADHLAAYDQPWRTLPNADLELSESADADLAKGSACLEVSLNHSLLKDGGQVIVSPCFFASTYNNPSRVQYEFSKCTANVTPVVFYTIVQEPLGEKDLVELRAIKTLLPNSPVFFLRIPLPPTPDMTESDRDAIYSDLRSSSIHSTRPPNVPASNDNRKRSKAFVYHSTGALEEITEVTTAQEKAGAVAKPPAEVEGQGVGAPSSSGTRSDSPQLNGPQSNGPQSNGPQPNGPLPNGPLPPTDHFSQMYIQKLREQISSSTPSFTIFQQLCDLNYLSILPAEQPIARRDPSEPYVVHSRFAERYEDVHLISNFTRHVLKQQLVIAANHLHAAQVRCLSLFIDTAFDMQRDMIVTPKRIEYAKTKEAGLYEALMEIASNKQEEIRQLILETIGGNSEALIKEAAVYNFIGVVISEDGQVSSIRDLKNCTSQIQDLVLSRINNSFAGKLVASVEILKESFTGTLQRCLESLEKNEEAGPGGVVASTHLKDIVNAAYQVEVTVRASSSILHHLLEKMRQAIQTLPWTTPPFINPEWKEKIAQDMIHSLSESRLARSICAQFKDRLARSHDNFLSSLRLLESRHFGRLERTIEQQIKLRKVHAPKVAKLALESTSLKDLVLYGMPTLGRELGRGQYGVVYACENWAGIRSCAIKSVVPPDDKHWNDLALEFYYTKNVPHHERVIMIRGSVIDYSYGGGCSPAVLLVMDRMMRDLYTAIKSGLEWEPRLQVALDVVEGIRFLHSQGLVHRDIKLKNVLMDKHNRGKITDLGFCKPEAMMSGSIVGTPIHMAPELFSGKYDGSVDTYAFGILFWYICAGHVKLPYRFEQCANKDQLWNSVKKGARPERLPQFTDECWDIMERCWKGPPAERPFLGDVEPQLQSMLENCRVQLHHMGGPAGGSSTPMDRSRNSSRSRTGSSGDSRDSPRQGLPSGERKKKASVKGDQGCEMKAFAGDGAYIHKDEEEMLAPGDPVDPLFKIRENVDSVNGNNNNNNKMMVEAPAIDEVDNPLRPDDVDLHVHNDK